MKIFKKYQKNIKEDISEVKTSKLGYFLLILMVIFGLTAGNTILRDLSRIPKRPIPPSYCISGISKYSLKNIQTMPRCNFNEIDKKFEIDKIYQEILPDLSKLVNLNKQISTNYSLISKQQNERDKILREYDVSLQEKMAKEQKIIDKDDLKLRVTNIDKNIEVFNDEIRKLTVERDNLANLLSSKVTELQYRYNNAQKKYDRDVSIYKVKIFFIQFLFVLPLFIFVFRYYLKLKRENSKYTIIWTAINITVALLLAKILLIFIWMILPKNIFKLILSFINKIPFIKYVIYYVAIGIIFSFFGGLVYYIQKKIFSVKAVSYRRFKNKECPGCGFTIYKDSLFCPNCGNSLYEICPSCNEETLRNLKFCQKCGSEKSR
ncbi:zinc ribbon domain-containing protein [Deferribacteraceae bacterium V6Fe1]|nr:zinc ribbon domain-containing protein [Deferribacteraceae bacterium V6Fe1]